MILAVLQARTSSKRLPGKVLLPLAGAPMLARQIERLRRSRHIDRLIVATSICSGDDSLALLAGQAGVGCYRGSLDDVLDRFYQAAEPHVPSHVVRLTGDCPLADWEVIDRVIKTALEGDFDYASNTLIPTWPDGLDVEIVTFEVLRTAWREAHKPVEREHVMPFITSQPERFRLGSVEHDVDLSQMRWTVDEPPDYDFVSTIYETLYPTNPAFTTEDILKLVSAAPELARINGSIARNEGLRKSEEAVSNADQT